MALSDRERRLAENEMVFRSYNEQVQQDVDSINQLAQENGNAPMRFDGDALMYFYCECSDENCDKRIKMTPDAYNRAHESRDTFTVLCGHQVPSVEHIIAEEDGYCIVQKYKAPPPFSETLNETDIDNS